MVIDRLEVSHGPIHQVQVLASTMCVASHFWGIQVPEGRIGAGCGGAQHGCPSRVKACQKTVTVIQGGLLPDPTSCNSWAAAARAVQPARHLAAGVFQPMNVAWTS
jgi:hypothetical protein